MDIFSFTKFHFTRTHTYSLWLLYHLLLESTLNVQNKDGGFIGPRGRESHVGSIVKSIVSTKTVILNQDGGNICPRGLVQMKLCA